MVSYHAMFSTENKFGHRMQAKFFYVLIPDKKFIFLKVVMVVL